MMAQEFDRIHPKEDIIMDENLNFLDQFEGQGFDKLSGEDYQIPFLRILQSLSPQCNKNGDNYVLGAEPGLFYNTVTNRIYGKTVRVIPVDFEKVWLEFKPNRGGFVARHEPNSIRVDKSNFSSWKTEYGHEIVESYNFYCLLPDFSEDGLTVFTLNSSGIKHAKNWNSQISFTRTDSGKKAPYFSSVWELKSTYNKNDKGTWFSIGSNTTNIRRDRFITADEYKDQVRPAKEIISSLSIDYAQIEANPIQSEKDLLSENTTVNY
jgi:hypothetical protein